jgi:hypothetical protein
MAADEWNEQLRCPKCRKTGIASLSQGQRDDIPTVQGVVPDGFKVIQTQYGPDFIARAAISLLNRRSPQLAASFIVRLRSASLKETTPAPGVS